jgi:hypothetical protein
MVQINHTPLLYQSTHAVSCLKIFYRICRISTRFPTVVINIRCDISQSVRGSALCRGLDRLPKSVLPLICLEYEYRHLMLFREVMSFYYEIHCVDKMQSVSKLK